MADLMRLVLEKINRLEAEKATLEQKLSDALTTVQNLSLLSDTPRHSIYIVDKYGNYLAVNPLFLNTHGADLSQIIGHNYDEFHNSTRQKKEFHRVLNDIIQTGNDAKYDVNDENGRWYSKTGRRIVLENSEFGVHFVSEDVTEYMQLLMQNRDLKILRQIIEEFTHTIINEITPLMSYADSARTHPNNPTRILEDMNLIVQSCDGIVRSIRRLEPLYQNNIHPGQIKVIHSIESAIESLTNTYPQIKPKIVFNITEEQNVFADYNNLTSIMYELLKNSFDSLTESENPEKQIIISAENHTPTSKESLIRGHTYSKISIADNGVGIHPDNIENVFTPFYSTKPKGPHYQGLGLTRALSHARNNNGTITVESRYGENAVFTLYLPKEEIKPITHHQL